MTIMSDARLYFEGLIVFV